MTLESDIVSVFSTNWNIAVIAKPSIVEVVGNITNVREVNIASILVFPSTYRSQPEYISTDQYNRQWIVPLTIIQTNDSDGVIMTTLMGEAENCLETENDKDSPAFSLMQMFLSDKTDKKIPFRRVMIGELFISNFNITIDRS